MGDGGEETIVLSGIEVVMQSVVYLYSRGIHDHPLANLDITPKHQKQGKRLNINR